MTIPVFVTQSNPTKRSNILPRPHPGEVLKRRCLSKTKLNRDEVAKNIGISAKHLSRFINCHVSVKVNLALKLEAWTNISASAWFYYQEQYDLYKRVKLEES